MLVSQVGLMLSGTGVEKGEEKATKCLKRRIANENQEYLEIAQNAAPCTFLFP